MKQVDMSEQAVLRRLRTVDRLRKLCLTLMKAKQVKKNVETEKSSIQSV
jgi:hypothetical protein